MPSNRFFALHRNFCRIALQANLSLALANIDLSKVSSDLVGDQSADLGPFLVNVTAFQRRLLNIRRAIKMLRVQMTDENYAEDPALINSPALAESGMRMIKHGAASGYHLNLILSYHREGGFYRVLDEFEKQLAAIDGTLEVLTQKSPQDMQTELFRVSTAWFDFLLLSVASGMVLAEINYMAAGYGSLIAETA